MASELIVQTLKGPTSGANANKIIVPTGQTLDASAGALIPDSGAVVQTTVWEIPATSVSTDGSWAVSTTPTIANTYNVGNYSFTKKFSGSKVVCVVAGHVDHANITGTPTIVALFESGSGTLIGSGYRHIRYNNDEPFPYSFSGTDTSTGTSKTYTLRCHCAGGPMYFSRMASGDFGHSKFTVTLMEIAG